MKKTVALLLALVICLSLFGCSNTKNVTDDQNNDTDLQNTEAAKDPEKEKSSETQYLLTKETYYNEAGNVRSYVSYRYDDNGQLVSTCDDDNVIHEYNSENQLIRRKNGDVTYEYEYYDSGRRCKEYKYDDSIYGYQLVEYEYDSSGNEITKTCYKPNSDTDIGMQYKTEYEYDANGNVVFETHDSGNTVEYKYDDHNNIIYRHKVKDGVEYEDTYSYEYDDNGNILKKYCGTDEYDSYNGFLYHKWTLYEYDENNNLTKETYYKEYDDDKMSYKAGYTIYEYQEFQP